MSGIQKSSKKPSIVIGKYDISRNSMTFKNIFSKDGTKILVVTSLVIGISVVAYLWFIKTPSFALFETWVQGNFVLFYIFLVLTKVIGVVWPPLPGSLFTLASIPFLGLVYSLYCRFCWQHVGFISCFFSW